MIDLIYDGVYACVAEVFAFSHNLLQQKIDDVETL